MSRYLLAKVVCIFVLVVLLLVRERESHHESVVAEVVSSTSGVRTLVGPVLVIPYRKVDVTVDVPRASGYMVSEQGAGAYAGFALCAVACFFGQYGGAGFAVSVK